MIKIVAVIIFVFSSGTQEVEYKTFYSILECQAWSRQESFMPVPHKDVINKEVICLLGE